jgi:type IV pilus assembly protein PilC
MVLMVCHAMSNSAASKHLFYAEMAKLLEAGFGIREAAVVLSGTGLPAEQSKLLDDLHLGLEAGRSITDSMCGNNHSLGEFEKGIIGAGERGGRLAQAMRHLADYFGMLASARRELLKGLVHPVIVLHLGIFISTVPTAMFQGDSGTSNPTSDFFTTLIMAYGLAAAVFFAGRACLKSARTNARVDSLLRRIPLLGKTRSNLAMAAFCKVYHTCLLAGIPMHETVAAAVDASQSGLMRKAAKRLQANLADGQPIGPAMMAEPVFPKSFARSYATGEAAGTLDKDLAHWAKLFHDESAANAKTLSAAVPRALYLLMLCYVGWQIVDFYNSYYSSMLEQLE